MNHWLRSALRAIVIMVLDVVAFAAFGITMGRNSPQWITKPMFWVLVWPVWVFRSLLPPTPGAHPSILAWFCGGIVDIVWVTLFVDWLWRPKPAAAKSAAATE